MVQLPLSLRVHTQRVNAIPGGWLHGWPVRRTLLTAGMAAVAAVTAALLLPVPAAIVCGCVLPATFLIPRLRHPTWLLCGAVAALCLFYTAGYRYVRVQPLEDLAGETDTVSGWITDVPVSGHMYTLEVSEAGHLPVGSRLLLYCPDTCAPDRYETVTARVRLEELYPTQSSYRAKGVFLCAYPADYGEESVRITGRWEQLPFSHSLQPLKQRLITALRQALPGDEGALLAALCLGDRSGLSDRTEAAFRGSGVTHLLVVSGLHLSMVAAAVLAMFHGMRLGRRGATVLTMPVILLFMLLIGGTPSVIRAGIMCLVWLAGRLFRSRADGLNSLGLAAMLLMLYNPYMLLSVGFQLSFLATAGVLALSPRLCGWLPAADREERGGITGLAKRIGVFVYTGVAVCVSATLPTLPLLCYYFGGFPLTAPLANLLMVLPAGWALVSGWLGLLLYCVPLLRPLGHGLLLAAGVLSRYLQGAADLCSPEAAYVTVNAGWQIALVSGICLLLIYGILRDRVPMRRILAGILTLAVLAAGVGHVLTRSATRLTLLPTGQGAALLLQQGNRAALLLTDGDGLPDATRAVEEAGCGHLDAIVVNTAEPVDAGQLAELIRLTDAPSLYTATADRWTAGLTQAATVMSAGDSLSLWQSVRLTMLTETWWRLQTDGDTLLLCTDPDAPYPGGETACGVVVYVGVLPTVPIPARQGVLICPAEQPTAMQPIWTDSYPITLLTEESLTFTTRLTGEWSIVPWL